MNPEFWNKRKVLITGHTGFKGSWLSLWLNKLGAQVTGFALAPPTQPNLFELAGVSGRISSIVGDVRDLELLRKTISDTQPEIVIHMAAQSLVRLSYDEPVATYATNVMGTVNLFEAVRLNPGITKCVLNVTSDKCYENREWERGYTEDDAMGGYDPYSSSKGCAELVTSAYRRSFFNDEKFEEHGISLASARAGNVIGGGDWAEDRLVSDIMAGYLDNHRVVIRNTDATRPWQHVLEPLYGY
ncbi:MAG: CDP-glucose 4,6-dehydratase, partial [Gammaproteobacteria bacterium SG8_11]